jgi:hypothetical protein
LVVSVVAMTGCSWTMTTVPDDHRPGDPVECTDSGLRPELDFTMGVPLLALGSLVLGRTIAGDRPAVGDIGSVAGIFFIGLSAIWMVPAIVG